MGVALRAVADDGDGLALEGVEVGVFVVVNRGGHGVILRVTLCRVRVEWSSSEHWRLRFALAPATRRSELASPLAAVDAADHGDAAGADQLDDAEGAHQVDEGFDLFFLAGDFDDHLLGRHVDDLAAEDFAQLADFGAADRSRR